MKRTESQILNIRESQNHDYIYELQSKFPTINFKRLVKTESTYNGSKRTKTMESENIFIEGQIKKALTSVHLPTQAQILRRKFLYFSQNESKHEIYKFDDAKELTVKERFVIHYIGHATMLIQVSGFTILTDPIFYGLDRYYPEKTKSYPFIQYLPRIDVILITHNHRDHVDRRSLQELLEFYRTKMWSQPKVLVPMGDKKLLQTFGFLYITELDWFSRITIKGNRTIINFVSIPADQKSSRYQINPHKSLVTGWIINPEKEDVIFKYTGDTRSLSLPTQLAIDACIYNEITKKSYNIGSPEGNTNIPKIICFEPSGPNYTRCAVEANHQSSSYSALLKFIEIRNLSTISGIPIDSFLPRVKTVMFHHNKFQLGPDRFNEGKFVTKKLLNYLHLDDDILIKEYERQKRKLEKHLDREKLKDALPLPSRSVIANLPTHTSILVRSKDFIIQDIQTVLTQFDMDREKLRKLLIGYLVKNTVFPMIGERMTYEDLMKASFIDCEKYGGGNMQKELKIENTL